MRIATCTDVYGTPFAWRPIPRPIFDPARYPTTASVEQAGGFARSEDGEYHLQRALDDFACGLQRVLDGIAVFIQRRAESPGQQ